MSPDDLRELENLRQTQTGIRQQMTRLDRQMDILTEQLDEVDARLAKLSRAQETPPAVSLAPPPLPAPKQSPAPPAHEPELAPLARPIAAPKALVENNAQAAPDSAPPHSTAAPLSTPAASPLRPSAAPPRDSIEMQLGVVWLARIGIVILLTGLVFLGNYAYHTWVARLGAGGKLALLYAAGALLAGVGVWLGRRQESVRGYARVLVAGGAATIYYATYAAHFVPRLRVIESPLAGGALLLGLAGAFIWWADRRRSQSVALLTVLLSYYTSGINAIGPFTLFSSLLLTGAAVWFLVRHRWTALGWASLAGTYASYGFWRWHHAVDPMSHGSVLEAQPWGLGLAFLCGYWLLFTAAVFLSSSEAMPPARRTPFLSLNNAAFFAFAAQLIVAHRPGVFWWFALVYGAALLALAEGARRRRGEDRSMDGAYLAQGLALVTTGLASKFSGPQLALTLAVESAVLISGARWRHGFLFTLGAAITAAWAFVLTSSKITFPPALVLSLGAPVAALLVFDAWWWKQRRGELAALRFDQGAACFAVLGLVLAGWVVFLKIPDAWIPAAWAVAAVLCTASIYLLRLPEVTLLGQVFLLAAVAFTIMRGELSSLRPSPWWSPLPVVAAALALGHWWQRQRLLVLQKENQRALEIGCAGVLVTAGIFWMRPFFQGDAWLVGTAVISFATLLYGLATRAWPVALLGQIFTALAVIAFVGGLSAGHPHPGAAFAPIALLAATGVVVSFLAGSRLPALPGGERSFARIATLYRVAAFALLAMWALEYIPGEWLTAFFAAVGAALILIGCAWPNRERAWIGLAFGAIAMAVFWLRMGQPAQWVELAALLILPVSLRAGRRLAKDAAPLPLHAQTLVTGAATASVWLWVTRWTMDRHGSGGLTVAWSALALLVFATGLGLRERVYRLGGFAILALAVGRIFLIDVWKLETLGRIASFLVLGTVLLLLGFIYNRYSDAIRRWL